MASLFKNNSLFNPEIKDGVYQQGLFKGMNVQNAGALNAGIGAASSLLGSAISGGYSNDIGNAMQSLSGIASAIPGVGTIAGVALNTVGGLTNRFFGSKMNQQNIATVKDNIAKLRGFNSNAGDFDQFMSEAASAPTSISFSNKFIGSDGAFSNKARNLANDLRNQQDFAAQGVENSLLNNVDNLIDNQYNMLEATYGAFGGHLNTHGADWTDGIKYIENGGTHEENPNDGVQMGIAPDGEPNLVEEGEVIFNDYVFSNRLNVPQAIRNKYRLRGKKDLTFAEAAKKLQKEAEEMPNDAIAKRGLIASMTRLQNAQEALKGVNEFNDLSQTYGLGGSMFFDEGGKIRIAPSKKGTFTAAAKKHGMGVQEFASKVLANKDNYSPAMVKKANFARNFGGHKHAEGGHLFGKGGTSINDLRQFFRGYTGPFNQGHWNDYLVAHPGATMDSELANAIRVASLPTTEAKPESREVYAARMRAGNGNPDYVMPTLGEVSSYPPTTTPTPKLGNNTWVNNRIPPLFYAPAIGSGVQAFTDLMGWTNRPDYSSANTLMRAAANVPTVRSTPIGDYVAYTPFDRLFYANQLGNQAAGTRRNILNTSGGNRGMAMAGILAADAAAQTKLGELFRQADEFNLTNRFKGAEFNRGTNQYNSQNSLAAQQANIDVSRLKLNALQNALNMRDTERRLTDSNRSTNLTNFLTNLGTVGLQQFNNRQFNILGKNGYFDRRIRS